MASNNRVRRGFTILEVIVAAFLTAIAVTGLISVLGNVSNAQFRSARSEQLERAADQKLNELLGTGEFTVDGSGTFDDPDLQSLEWSSTYEDTGTENLAYVKVTVSQGDHEASADRLIFIPPQTDESDSEGAAAQ